MVEVRCSFCRAFTAASHVSFIFVDVKASNALYIYQRNKIRPAHEI